MRPGPQQAHGRSSSLSRTRTIIRGGAGFESSTGDNHWPELLAHDVLTTLPVSPASGRTERRDAMKTKTNAKAGGFIRRG